MSGVKWWHSNDTAKVDVIYGQQSQSGNQNSVALTDLWHLVFDCGVPGSEIKGLLNYYLICISSKVICQVKKNLI